MKDLLQFVGRFYRSLHIGNFFEVCSRMYNYVYTGYIKKGFKGWGQGSIIIPYAMNIKGRECISIGDGTQLGKNIQLTAWTKYNNIQYAPQITIGNNCVIRDFAHISSINKIVIGNNLLTGTNVLITDNSHGRLSKESIGLHPSKRDLISNGPVIIGDNVWLGNNVIVLPNVSIGSGVIIGANSVVTKDIPQNCVAAGVPAKIIKQL